MQSKSKKSKFLKLNIKFKFFILPTFPKYWRNYYIYHLSLSSLFSVYWIFHVSDIGVGEVLFSQRLSRSQCSRDRENWWHSSVASCFPELWLESLDGRRCSEQILLIIFSLREYTVQKYFSHKERSMHLIPGIKLLFLLKKI